MSTPSGTDTKEPPISAEVRSIVNDFCDFAAVCMAIDDESHTLNSLSFWICMMMGCIRKCSGPVNALHGAVGEADENNVAKKARRDANVERCGWYKEKTTPEIANGLLSRTDALLEAIKRVVASLDPNENEPGSPPQRVLPISGTLTRKMLDTAHTCLTELASYCKTGAANNQSDTAWSSDTPRIQITDSDSDDE